MFRKVLIANRGEIAVRVMRTLREMGIASVAVYSDADRASLHVRMADEAEHVGPAASSRKLSAHRPHPRRRQQARRRSHPSRLRISQRERGIRGGLRSAPASSSSARPRHSIRSMGSKTAARQIAVAARRARWLRAPITASPSKKRARSARAHGYPVLLKAVAGGGGKGMRRVDREADLESALPRCVERSRRALSAIPRSTSRS